MTESGWDGFFEPVEDEDGMEAETTELVDEDGMEPEVVGHQRNVNLHSTPVPAHRINHTF